ncbi:hypothetical protein Baya_14814 [Bagarius yarrelli]|uniref:Uncharacterized protein n=1 Tax=Bagarius yarrelli TaxID=175774 RepID=A0A556V9Y9_BAGYA|nr:hypothetical protein Baya_14814 [Bagarius yarrelli]
MCVKFAKCNNFYVILNNEAAFPGPSENKHLTKVWEYFRKAAVHDKHLKIKPSASRLKTTRGGKKKPSTQCSNAGRLHGHNSPPNLTEEEKEEEEEEEKQQISHMPPVL